LGRVVGGGREISDYWEQGEAEACSCKSWSSSIIQGRVLEFGDSRYTLKFGGDRVRTSDVPDFTLWKPDVTILADLIKADHIPSDTFDCIIMTQTLQLIYDVRAALPTSYRILKPGGILLATFPGISRMARSFPY
jgi:SAM-dependent methyltransferase